MKVTDSRFSPASRYTIVLINHGKTMMDQDATFKQFTPIVRDDNIDSFVTSLEDKYNMRCCVMVKES